MVVNLISSKLFFRLDFTADKRYTLSEATKNTLKDLGDVITVTAYFSEDLPPQLLGTRKDFRDLLVEYEKRSDGNLVYEFINPNEDDESENQGTVRRNKSGAGQRNRKGPGTTTSSLYGCGVENEGFK